MSEDPAVYHAKPLDLVLASSSPRRRELLAQIGVQFRVVVADVDESVLPGESPADYVVRLAREKALEVQRREGAALPVLGADTAVILEGDILCKPRDRAEAESMLGRLSGNTHEVYSAVALAVGGDEVLDVGPGQGEVLTLSRPREAPVVRVETARGALLRHYELKLPISQRLNDAEWSRLLAHGELPGFEDAVQGFVRDRVQFV